MIELNLTVVIQLAIVLTLMVILSQAVFKPFLTLLQERKSRVERGERRARELRQKADALMERYREAMAQASAQGATIREKIRQESLAKEMEILKKVAEEANREIQEMKMKMSEELGAARSGLRTQSQKLSREIAEKILGRNLQ